MRPLKVLELQRSIGLDFGADCVLDLLSDYPNMTPTQTIVDECLKDKVASPTTTHKKLALLKKVGLVKEVKHPTDKDQRKCYIMLTPKGMEYLNKWEGGEK